MMRTVYAATLVTVGWLSVCAPAQAAGEPAKTAQAAGGQVLTDQKGMTLYTFDKDASGKSACNGPCATNWPPLVASADAKPMGKYTVITRDDGVRQWAYSGKPLYTWAKDAKPGDTTGDGVNSVWHVAKP
ncbi:COG4315 family predicted lipoprotein [Azospirillum sp.]|uniref:COG4315 family predicted lipoprotein n=1 Tax=Azospirillum sp. TaxID=34012 RepID=UPI003D75F28B